MKISRILKSRYAVATYIFIFLLFLVGLFSNNASALNLTGISPQSGENFVYSFDNLDVESKSFSGSTATPFFLEKEYLQLEFGNDYPLTQCNEVSIGDVGFFTPASSGASFAFFSDFPDDYQNAYDYFIDSAYMGDFTKDVVSWVTPFSEDTVGTFGTANFSLATDKIYAYSIFLKMEAIATNGGIFWCQNSSGNNFSILNSYLVQYIYDVNTDTWNLAEGDSPEPEPDNFVPYAGLYPNWEPNIKFTSPTSTYQMPPPNTVFAGQYLNTFPDADKVGLEFISRPAFEAYYREGTAIPSGSYRLYDFDITYDAENWQSFQYQMPDTPFGTELPEGRGYWRAFFFNSTTNEVYNSLGRQDPPITSQNYGYLDWTGTLGDNSNLGLIMPGVDCSNTGNIFNTVMNCVENIWGWLIYWDAGLAVEIFDRIEYQDKIPFAFWYETRDLVLVLIEDTPTQEIPTITVEVLNGTLTFLSVDMLEQIPYKDTFRMLIGYGLYAFLAFYMWRLVFRFI